MRSREIKAQVTEAAHSFDAELRTSAYHEIHSDEAQLGRLLSYLSPVRGQLILDLGTGNGYVAMAVARRQRGCRVVGIDVARRALARNLQQARALGLANIGFSAYDGVCLPFDNDELDSAVCRYAFHHFPAPQTTLEELSRTVRSGGRLVLADALRVDSDDRDFLNRFQALKDDGHVRMYRRSELIDLVCRRGFEFIDSFESSIDFTRGRRPAYDGLLAATPDRILRAYTLAVAEREMSLKLPILNAVFVNRRARQGDPPPV